MKSTSKALRSPSQQPALMQAIFVALPNIGQIRIATWHNFKFSRHKDRFAQRNLLQIPTPNVHRIPKSRIINKLVFLKITGFCLVNSTKICLRAICRKISDTSFCMNVSALKISSSNGSISIVEFLNQSISLAKAP